MSQKSERLVNLTIALLATKRYLTKSEIFRTVAGYDGDPVARDRMFERDKDDLRTLGIEIELGSFDPLFEDEPGYRISRDQYRMQLTGLTPEKVFLLSRAQQAWREASMSDSATLALRKVRSLGMQESESVADSPIVPPPPACIGEIIAALNRLAVATFEYVGSELGVTSRRVEPYRLSHKQGRWYLIARDIDKESLRTFRLDRISSEVQVTGRDNSYEIDKQLLEGYLSEALPEQIAEVALLHGRGNNLRSKGKVIRSDGEWDYLQIRFIDSDDLIRDILWNTDAARIISPESLRQEVIERVTRAVSLHG